MVWLKQDLKATSPGKGEGNWVHPYLVHLPQCTHSQLRLCLCAESCDSLALLFSPRPNQGWISFLCKIRTSQPCPGLLAVSVRHRAVVGGCVQLFCRQELICAVGLPLLSDISQIHEVQPTSEASLAFIKVLSTSALSPTLHTYGKAARHTAEWEKE